MAQALLHSTVKMTVLPLFLIKKAHAWSLLFCHLPDSCKGHVQYLASLLYRVRVHVSQTKTDSLGNLV